MSVLHIRPFNFLSFQGWINRLALCFKFLLFIKWLPSFLFVTYLFWLGFEHLARVLDLMPTCFPGNLKSFHKFCCSWKLINHHQNSLKFRLINKQLIVRKALFVFDYFVRSNGWGGRSGWQRCFKTLKLSFLQCLCEVECAISHWLAFPATNNKLLVEGRGPFLIFPTI